MHTIEPLEELIARKATPAPPWPIRVPRRQGKSIFRVRREADGSSELPGVVVVVALYS